MVNPDRPWPRPETPRPALDATSSETLELWAAQPEWDTRSIEEFAADGGRPMGPPNRDEVGAGVGFFAFVRGLPLLAFRFFRWILVALKGDPDRGKLYPMPELPRFVPAPPPPSTPLPRAPIGGTGETRRWTSTLGGPPDLTGHLRSSLGPGGAGGEGVVFLTVNERRQALGLPPTDSTGAR